MTDEHDGQGLTRRRLIGGAAATAAAAALPSAAEARKRKHKRKRRRPRRRVRRVDVAIVGAGLAGLTAARQVVRAGRSALVIEARARVGGRTLNHDIGGGKIIEVGGQWIGPTQDHLAALAKELGIGTFNTYNDGNYIFYRNGLKTPYSQNTPVFGAVPPDLTGAAEAEVAITKLDQMAATVPLDAPWDAPNAGVWDAQTFETWKLANASTDGGRFLLDLGIEAVWAAEPRDVSLLHVLFYIAAAGNEGNPGTFERLINTRGGAQESRFVGGSQLVSLRMAQQLGKRILLKAPVRRIVDTGTSARVETDSFNVFAKQVIVAMPPALTARIDYHPALPALRDQLTQRFPQGNAIKCAAIYDRPFWRDQGLAGQVTSDAEPVRVTFDNSPPDGSPGVMLGFIEGALARKWSQRPAAERQAAVLHNFATYFGDKALSPTGYVEMNWAEEVWTRGCYVGFTPPGVLTDYGRFIREPAGRIHWAGAETATVWNGYMEGAVRSGERAAHEALASL